jgi:hypothetical protein
MGFQEAPHLQDLSKIILQTPKAKFPKRNFSLIEKAIKQRNRGRKTKALKTEGDQAMV